MSDDLPDEPCPICAKRMFFINFMLARASCAPSATIPDGQFAMEAQAHWEMMECCLDEDWEEGGGDEVVMNG